MTQTIEIPLTRGLVAYIDEEDYERVAKYKWLANRLNKGKTFYTLRSVQKNRLARSILMHRFIMNVKDTNIHVDHIDGNGLNNTKNNLRLCNRYENLQNSSLSKRNKAGFKGVYFNKKHQKFYARICVFKKQIYLGCFDSPISAHLAYQDAAKKYFGKFARFE